MILYWTMFLLPMMASMSPYRLDRLSRVMIMVLLGVVLTFIIGLRDHVGHDWNNYMKMFERADGSDFYYVITSVEPGYAFLNWASSRLGYGIYGVNAACAAILVFGLFKFLERQPNFWRTLAIATPVLLIGIGMGATRQATAIGFLMLAFNAFQDRKVVRYLAFVGLAVLFHRSSAVFFLPAWFIHGQLRIWPLILGGLVFFASSLFLRDAATYYQTSYVGTDIQASGALPRAALNILAAGIFFYYRRRWMERYDDGPLFTIMAGVILLMAPAVLFAAAATDRMSMYLLPIQLAIFARLPSLVPLQFRTPVILAIYAGFTVLLFTWLFFSPFAQSSWIPYGNLTWSGEVPEL
ncbi:MAG: EpsG family protein [Caulobacteraceae bacterium]|nr:EpsG family protein [Caulobacter sp.]RYF95694.1 MAG: EpsG family protein [Caulobacteraceae bacterium]